MADPRAADGVTTDPFFVGRYRQKIGEVRASIADLEAVVLPMRRVVDEGERRIALLRETERQYLAALDMNSVPIRGAQGSTDGDDGGWA